MYRVSLFDHLVGAGEQRWRNGKAKSLSGLEIDDQLNFGALLDRQVGRFLALENPAGIPANQVPRAREIPSIGNQPTGRGELTIWIDCRQCMTRCQCSKFIRSAVE